MPLGDFLVEVFLLGDDFASEGIPCLPQHVLAVVADVQMHTVDYNLGT